jgi:hypothetical protein
MIRYRVEPKPLPSVRELHYTGIFGEFEDVVDVAIARYAGSEDPVEQERARFFRYLKLRVDPAKYGAMQDFQLTDEKVRRNLDFTKYIDPTMWFESKLAMAHLIGLDTRAPISILDIGTGPAHFPVVVEFYGHSVIGTELPVLATGQLERGHLYDALGDIYQIRRIPLKIEPFTPLPDFGQRFDMVTTFLAAFNVDMREGPWKPWTIEAWRFFMRDLAANVLSEGGEFFANLAKEKTPDDVFAYLMAHAARFDAEKRLLHFTDFSRFNED